MQNQGNTENIYLAEKFIKEDFDSDSEEEFEF